MKPTKPHIQEILNQTIGFSYEDLEELGDMITSRLLEMHDNGENTLEGTQFQDMLDKLTIVTGA